jgi:hypothetical protein
MIILGWRDLQYPEIATTGSLRRSHFTTSTRRAGSFFLEYRIIIL